MIFIVQDSFDGVSWHESVCSCHQNPSRDEKDANAAFRQKAVSCPDTHVRILTTEEKVTKERLAKFSSDGIWRDEKGVLNTIVESYFYPFNKNFTAEFVSTEGFSVGSEILIGGVCWGFSKFKIESIISRKFIELIGIGDLPFRIERGASVSVIPPDA